MKLTVSATMSNGEFRRRNWQAEAIIIRRADIERIHRYARQNCTPRDYLIFRLPLKVGLRTGEIASFRIENIDFDTRSFYVLDSKQKELYPLPLDPVTLQLVQDYVRDKLEGYVFTRTRGWKNVKRGSPLSDQAVWNIIHGIGEDAGVKGFKPRSLREYFSAQWALVEKKSVVVLQRILRHKSLETTQVYVQKLVFFEDVQREYDQSGPVMSDCVCRDCSLVNVCRFAPLPSCVDGCRFKPKVREELKRNE